MRYSFFKIEKTERDINFYDLLGVDWNLFKFSLNTPEYVVTELDAKNLNLLCFRLYGNIEVLDVLLLVNNIENPFELVAGVKIKIPAIQDFRDFLLENRAT